MLALRKLMVVLAAVSVAGLVPTAAPGSPDDIETASYPWVQPPAWVGTMPASEAVSGLPDTSSACTQPPAWVQICPAAPFTASTAYDWAQPSTGGPATAHIPNTPSTQPPAWIPITPATPAPASTGYDWIQPPASTA